jgi:hypothetical protein
VRTHYQGNPFRKHPPEQSLPRHVDRSHVAEVDLYGFTGAVVAPALFEFQNLIGSQISADNEAGSASVGKRLDGQHVDFSVKSRLSDVGDPDHVTDLWEVISARQSSHSKVSQDLPWTSRSMKQGKTCLKGLP